MTEDKMSNIHAAAEKYIKAPPVSIGSEKIP